MTSFTDVFGGASVAPADTAFRAVSLTASITTVWPEYASTGNQIATIMKVDASVAGKSVTLPDCRMASNGYEVLFDNCGSESFTVLDAAGATVATITAGQVKLLYLYDVSTAAGSWRVTLLGVGTSSPDASQLVGYGLKAISNTLNFAPVLTEFSANYAVTASDRGKVFVWTGGSGTLTLPTTSGSTSDYSIEVRNQGTGTLTIAPVGGSLIDSSASIALVVSESCFVHMGASDWSTVGRGRNTQFNFTRLSKVVDGGTDNLTLTEASNVVQTYTGVLLSNQIVNMPAVVQVYYVANNTTGAYTLTFGCVGGGTSVSVTSGQAAILFCDGTNIINANTSLAGGVTALVFASGSASTPSVAIGSTTNGFYSPGVNELAATINGVQAVKIDSTGMKSTGSGSVTGQVESTAGAAQSVVNRPAGQTGSFRLRTAGSDRWSLNADNTAEAGANAGSDLALFAFDDAGASLGSVFTIVRATRVLSFTVAPAGLQATLVSGTNIKTVGGVSVLGSGDIGTLGVGYGGTGTTTSTGTGATVRDTSPTLVTPLLGTPTSGNLSNCTADGTNSVGYKNIPQNSQSTAYTLVLADAGKHILHPSADTTARTMTIPANSSVAYPIGTALTFVNQASAGVMTIAINTDTMRLAGAGTTGSRTLAANGIATALKLTATEWIISGTGLT